MVESAKTFICLLMVILLVIIALMVSDVIEEHGFKHGVASVRAEAAKASLAEWVPDHNGVCSFSWKIK